MEVKEILDIADNLSKEDIELVVHAFEFAKEAHEGQERRSGDPYFVHAFETAKTLAHFNLGAKIVAAGLLHDTCEDAGVTKQKMKKEFGEEIAFLVEGVTKLGTLKYKGVERQVENLRKMFLAMAKDIRVVLIKLADRLHNMKTLEHVRADKQKRIALETMEVYAPIADRLGIGEIKGQLEDLAFPYIYPEEYKKVKDLVKRSYEKKERELAKVKYRIKQELEANNLGDAVINSRVKRLYSVFKKLRKKETWDLTKIYDLIAVRIITKNTEDCYKILGIIHQMWRPLPGRIKDYIALPKLNGYQSLHTTVFAADGKITEIQIRTANMDKEADHGIAAYWAYSESGKLKKGVPVQKHLQWVNQLAEWQKDARKSKNFIEDLRIDFFNDRVFCFTPRGDVVDLPEGATVIDFAYAIHGDIGNHASGAMVNSKYVSLNIVLKNGDIVDIKTEKNKEPSIHWLKHAKTSFARRQIKISVKKRGGIFSKFV
jgi:GTP pyrophosphokinase